MSSVALAFAHMYRMKATIFHHGEGLSIKNKPGSLFMTDKKKI
jgi:hypothetical protein